MAKYDEQLERMNFLMEYKNEPKKAISNIEYHANGADGKVYGILKEGTKYYIKTTEPGKENISEAYDYINGFINRRENEYKSYNEATKHLELKLMSLNEAYGKKSDVSTVDFKRNEKALANLTEEARRELDRMNQIFENSCKIGRDCVCDLESKGSASPEDTEKNNDPFSEKTDASLDKDPKFNATVDSATDNKEVKGVDEDLQSDKMKSANSGSEKDYKDAHDDLDGEGVADKKPAGAKAVKMNEGVFEYDAVENEFNPDIEGDDISADDFETDGDAGDPTLEPDYNDNPLPVADEPVEEPADGGIVGDADDEDLDSLLEELMSEEDAITGPNGVMDKEDNPINGTNNGVNDETGEEWKRIEEEEGFEAKQGDEETMKSYQSKGSMPAQSWDKMSVKKLTESIFNKLVEGQQKKTKKMSLQEMIDKMVKESLDAWGKHPRYQKEPMTTPANKEVLAGTADRDWNDDSAKGEQPYGKKIGDGKPFDKEVVDLLTDQVIAKIKETYKK